MATLKLRLKEYKEALEMYEMILSDYPEVSIEIERKIQINRSICYRYIGDFENLSNITAKIIRYSCEVEDANELVEMCLIASKNLLYLGDDKEAMTQISKTINIIESVMNQISRIHYRRGYINKYINRIITLFASNYSGDVDGLLEFVAFSKKNIFSDWLSLLDWFDEVIDSKIVKTQTKIELTNDLEKLIEFGEPILSGFHEKYDDPFDAIQSPIGKMDFSENWKNFNLSVEKIQRDYSFISDPYESSKIANVLKNLKSTLEKNSVIISLHKVEKKIILFGIIKTKWLRIELDLEKYLKYSYVLYQYQTGQINKFDFIKILNITVKDISSELQKLIDLIICQNVNIIYISDNNFLSWLPIESGLLFDEKLETYIKSNKICIVKIPVMYNEKKSELSIKKILNIYNSNYKLDMIEEEVQILMEYFESENELFDLAHQKLHFESIVEEKYDVIHFASHNVPISLFTDPQYSSIGLFSSENKNRVDFSSLMKNLWKSRHYLCIFSMCDSGSITSKNYYEQFDTNELISYPVLGLLNRRSKAISTNWKMLDILGFIFFRIFGENLSNNSNNLEYAFTKTTLDLKRISKEEIIKLIQLIKDPILREEKCEIVNKMKGREPFNNPYFYGLFSCSSLIRI